MVRTNNNFSTIYLWVHPKGLDSWKEILQCPPIEPEEETALLERIKTYVIFS